MSVVLPSHFHSGDPPWSAANAVLDISRPTYSLFEEAMFSLRTDNENLDRREKALKDRIRIRKRAVFKAGIVVGPSKPNVNARRASTPEPESPIGRDYGGRRSRSPPRVRSAPYSLHNLVDREHEPSAESPDYPSVWTIDPPIDLEHSQESGSQSGIGDSPQAAVHSSNVELVDSDSPEKRAASPPISPSSPRPSLSPAPWLNRDNAAWYDEQLARYPSVDSEPDHNKRILRELAFNQRMAILERHHPYHTRILTHFNPMRGNMAQAVYHFRQSQLPKIFRNFREPWKPIIRSRSYCEGQTEMTRARRLRPYVLNESRHCADCLHDSMCKRLLIWRYQQAKIKAGHYNMSSSSMDSLPSLTGSTSSSVRSTLSSPTSALFPSQPHDFEIKLTGLDLELEYEGSDVDWEEAEVMNICEPDEDKFHPYPIVVSGSLSEEFARAGVLSASHSPSSHSGISGAGMDMDDDWHQRIPDSPRIRDMDSFDSFDSDVDDRDEDMVMEETSMY